jgi:hypothetical protein
MSEEQTQTPAEPTTAAVPAETNGEPGEFGGRTFEEIVDEWRWIREERPKGTFDEYAGKHVAVYKKKILGASWDPYLLGEYIQLRDGIPAGAIVFVYIEG